MTREKMTLAKKKGFKSKIATTKNPRKPVLQ